MAEKEQKRNLKKYLPYLIAGVIVILALSVGGYFYLQYQGAQEKLAVNPATGVPQVSDLVERVGKLMELPAGETPTVAAVSDVSKLKGQAFFVNAQNGDQVLIYSKAKKAVLYRPSTNKIIEVGPVNLSAPAVPEGQESASGSATPSPTGAQPSVFLLNGTTVVGLTRTAETAFTEGKLSITIADRDNAAKNDYVKSVVVDLTGKNAALAKSIAGIVKGTVGTLPAGETKPDADIVVILGTDFIK